MAFAFSYGQQSHQLFPKREHAHGVRKSGYNGDVCWTIEAGRFVFFFAEVKVWTEQRSVGLESVVWQDPQSEYE